MQGSRQKVAKTAGRLHAHTHTHLVEPVVVDGDVVQLGALFDVLEVRLRGREGKLVFVHVGDVPQDVVAAALGYHLNT